MKNHSAALLWRFSSGSRALYAASFALLFFSVFCGFLLPQVIHFVVDAVGGASTGGVFFSFFRFSPFSFEDRLLAGLIVMGLAAAGGVSRFLHQKTLAMASEGLIKRLRNALFSHIQRLPYEWHVRIQTGDIVQRCTSDVEIVRGFAALHLVEIVRAAALVVFAYAMLFPINAVLSFASFAWLPVVFFYSLFFLRRVSADFLEADEAEGRLLSIAQENFTGVRVVRAFGRERYEAERFDRQNRHYADLWVRLGRLLSTYWGLGDTLTGLQMVTICAAGAYQAAAGALTIGEFIVFLTYNAMTIWPVRGLGRVLTEADKAGVSLGRLREILDTPPQIDETVLSFAAGYDTYWYSTTLSAVDVETDAKIVAALRRRLKGVTALIIAHRVSSVSWADAVMVMENGRVAEFGPPGELLLRNGLYKRLHDMQSFKIN